MSELPTPNRLSSRQHALGRVGRCDNDRLIGMVTDRDIAVRCVAKGKGPETKVREVMSDEVKYYF